MISFKGKEINVMSNHMESKHASYQNDERSPPATDASGNEKKSPNQTDRKRMPTEAEKQEYMFKHVVAEIKENTYLTLAMALRKNKETYASFLESKRKEDDGTGEWLDRNCAKSLDYAALVVRAYEHAITTLPIRSMDEIQADIDAKMEKLIALQGKKFPLGGHVPAADWLHGDTDEEANFWKSAANKSRIDDIKTIELPILCEEMLLTGFVAKVDLDEKKPRRGE